MTVRLAGYNVDSNEIGKASAQGLILTPETISAAYARISRSPDSVEQLRSKACRDVEEARRSNQSIVFDMGHSSIAEHAFFNLDLTGISRLAIESVEACRLGSYTEKSQRYVKLDKDFVIPKEVAGQPHLTQVFKEAVRDLFEAYNLLLQRLTDHLSSPEHEDGKGLSVKERRGMAREDARYVAALAATGQLGMSLNARSLENMARNLAASPLQEVRDLSGELVGAVAGIAPSLIRYTEPTAMGRWRHEPGALELETGSLGEVNLLDWPVDGDQILAAACLVEKHGGSLGLAREVLGRQSALVRHTLLEVLDNLGLHDPAPRAFETMLLTFELECSASCFAQLKRHRMATLVPGAYAPVLGYTVPPLVLAADGEEIFARAMKVSETAWMQIGELAGQSVGEYILTNAHRRRVLVTCNPRELIHMSRLRMDRHAQWDIRRIVGLMCKAVETVMPGLGMFLAGKDEYPGKKAAILGKV